LNSVQDFSLKRVFTEEGGLDKEFLELLNGKLEEGVRVQEFLAEYGKIFRAEDGKRFRNWNRRIAWHPIAYNLPQSVLSYIRSCRVRRKPACLPSFLILCLKAIG
jgi:hypothetical protein